MVFPVYPSLCIMKLLSCTLGLYNFTVNFILFFALSISLSCRLFFVAVNDNNNNNSNALKFNHYPSYGEFLINDTPPYYCSPKTYISIYSVSCYTFILLLLLFIVVIAQYIILANTTDFNFENIFFYIRLRCAI